MAKIRSIKVEFWTSEQVVSCSIHARLLFIGLWNFCDDGGNHPASSFRLKMEVFPADDFSTNDVDGWINELLGNGLIRQYSVDSVDYWHVTGFKKHQIIRKAYYKFPPELYTE